MASFFGSIAIMYASNLLKCDENTLDGCFLHDHDLKWRAHLCNNLSTLQAGCCIENCASSQYRFGSKCLLCSSFCTDCIGGLPHECSICNAGFDLSLRNICARQCDSYEFSTVDFKCSKCDPDCLKCFTEFDVGCTSCQIGYDLSFYDYSRFTTMAGSCKLSIPQGYSGYFREFPADNLLQECPLYCTACTDSFNCLSCSPGFIANPPLFAAGYSFCYPVE